MVDEAEYIENSLAKGVGDGEGALRFGEGLGKVRFVRVHCKRQGWE